MTSFLPWFILVLTVLALLWLAMDRIHDYVHNKHTHHRKSNSSNKEHS